MINRIYMRRTLYIFVAFLALYTIVGFFLVPWAGKKILIKRWGNFMGRHVAIESVSINPYALTVLAEGISIKEENGTDFISVRSLFVNFSIMSVLTLTPLATQCEMSSPIVNLVLKNDNSLNISDLLQSVGKSHDIAPVESKIFGFKISNAKIVNGNINFSDQIRQVVHHLENLNLNLPFLSTLEEDHQTTVTGQVDFSLNKVKMNMGLEALPFTPERKTLLTLKTGTIDLLTYLGYLPLPKTILVKHLETSLDLAATYSNSSLILTGAVDLTNIDIQGIDHTPLVAIPQMNFSLAPSDLLDKHIALSNVKVLSPEIHLDRDASGMLNFLKYLPDASNKTEGTAVPEEQEAKIAGDDNKASGDNSLTSGFRFQLGLGEITDASLIFTDAAVKTPFKTIVSPIFLQIKNLVADKAIQGEYSISLKSEAAESFASKGKFSTLPWNLEGAMTLGKINLSKYAPYYADRINFDIQEGLADVDLSFLVGTPTQLSVVVNNKALHLSHLKLWDRTNKETPIVIPELTITDSTFDLEKQHLSMGTIKTSQGKILLKRGVDTSINLVKNLMLLPQKSMDQKSVDQASSLPESSSPLSSIPGDKRVTSSDSSAIPFNEKGFWDISVESFLMDGYSLIFSDASTKELVSIDLSDISIHANNLKTTGKEAGGVEVDMAWNKTGKLRVTGEVNPSRLSAGLDISLTELDIKSVEPYFSDKIKIHINSGVAHAIGRLDLSMNEKKNPVLSFKGKAGVTNLASVDKETANDFFKCNIFYLSGMKVSLFPIKVLVDEISLTDFYSRVILSDKGEINLKQVFRQDSDPKVSPGSGSDASFQSLPVLPEIYVKNVTLQGGNIYFTDHLTQPNFTAHMLKIAGGITEFSSKNTEPAKLQLQGIHGQSSPLDIVGRIQPLASEKFFDLDISFKDIELNRFSPYSAKYIGYNIEKGKLLLDLKYKIIGNKLESQNRLFFDQLTLGEKVDSEDATSLPVPLAISLLKNSEGQINLDLPMGGNIDDPEFSFAGSLFAVFGNLITKVITAPFKFLGGMFGGGEELGFVNFEYGSDTIADDQILKLDQLVEILVKKKELKLVIEGTYDRIRDTEVLRQNRYEILLKSKTGGDLLTKGTATASIPDVKLLPEERAQAVRRVYEQAAFPKPRGEDGKEKRINTDEMEKLIQTNISIPDAELKTLAMARAENVRAYLLSTGKLNPARLFLRDSNPEKLGQGQDSNSKVLFSIE